MMKIQGVLSAFIAGYPALYSKKQKHSKVLTLEKFTR
jgi:hypothetical protein